MVSRIYQVYIADGFADDCEELIDRCLKTETLTYHAFCEIWKEMNFAHVFQGRSSGAETAELSEELIHIAKHYMIANVSNIEESIAGLFILYGLLNLQPYPGFAALRLVPDDMEALKRIEVVARRERRYDVLYILGAVLIKGPCQFHIEERERGMEPSIRKYLEGSMSIDKKGVRAKGVFYRQNGELDIIRELEGLSRRYKVAKSLINETKPVDPSLCYVDEKLPSELYTSFKKVINGIIDDNQDKELGENEDTPYEHYDAVQAIKAKAMKEVVNPIKHLTVISERKNNPPSPKKKMDIKTKAGKIKSGSPTKSLATAKRKITTKNMTAHSPKRKKVILENSDEDDDRDQDLNDDINVDEFEKGTNPGNDINNPQEYDDNEQEINIDIDCLPTLMRTEDHSIQVEIIRQMKDEQLEMREKNNSPKSLSHDTEDTIKNTDDLTVFKKPLALKEKLNWKRKRDQKKTNIKSKFKRLGMLPVANFDESK